jgi:hypothetical protein
MGQGCHKSRGDAPQQKAAGRFMDQEPDACGDAAPGGRLVRGMMSFREGACLMSIPVPAAVAPML